MKNYFKFIVLLALVLTGIGILNTTVGPLIWQDEHVSSAEDPERAPPTSEEAGSDHLDPVHGKVLEGMEADSRVSAETRGDKSDPTNEVEAQPDEESIEQKAADIVERALSDGDMTMAYRAFQSIQGCALVPLTDEAWKATQEKLEAFRNDPDHELPIIQTIEDHFETQWNKRAECQVLADLRTPTFVEELISRASGGDPVARFLYAMWPPKEEESVTMETEDLLSYETRALEFSLDNLNEGHPLGLLAFGISYHQLRYFTPARHARGYAYLIAAELCSGGAFELQPMIDSILKMFDRSAVGSPNLTAEDILVAGTRLHDAHCASSIRNSKP